MAHYCYKESLVNQRVRDRYQQDVQRLRQAHTVGIIDDDEYAERKQMLTPEAVADQIAAEGAAVSGFLKQKTKKTPSLSSASEKTRTGTILARNNLSARSFKANAQSEEQRRKLRRDSKTKEEKGKGPAVEPYDDDDTAHSSHLSFEEPQLRPPVEISIGGNGEGSASGPLHVPFPPGASDQVFGVPTETSVSDISLQSRPASTLSPLASLLDAGPNTLADKYIFKARKHDSFSSAEQELAFTDSMIERLSLSSEDRMSFEVLRNATRGSFSTWDRTLAPQKTISTYLLEYFASQLTEYESQISLFRFVEEGDELAAAERWSERLADSGSLEVRVAVRKHAWFLMGLKWLFFGRVLFSPGHNLLREGQKESGARNAPLRVLDLDGSNTGRWLWDTLDRTCANVPTADWSWQCALEYPDALVYGLDTAKARAAISPLDTFHAPPGNFRTWDVDTHSDLSALPSGSFDVISSRALSSFIHESDWMTVLRECYRLLKPGGYLEITVVDPVLDNAGSVTSQWIIKNVLVSSHPRTFDRTPSNNVPRLLESAKFGDIRPSESKSVIADNSVTGLIGRYLYDSLYINPSYSHFWNLKLAGMVAVDPRMGQFWTDGLVIEECRELHTSIRLLRCVARKPGGSSDPASHV